MNRNGWIATTLFAAVSLAGLVTLFSQADLAPPPAGGRRPAARWTSLNPSPREGEPDTLGDLVPAALKRGAHIETSGKTEREGKPRSGTTLRLR